MAGSRCKIWDATVTEGRRGRVRSPGDHPQSSILNPRRAERVAAENSHDLVHISV
jgi:hypothetical protein